MIIFTNLSALLCHAEENEQYSVYYKKTGVREYMFIKGMHYMSRKCEEFTVYLC